MCYCAQMIEFNFSSFFFVFVFGGGKESGTNLEGAHMRSRGNELRTNGLRKAALGSGGVCSESLPLWQAEVCQ